MKQRISFVGILIGLLSLSSCCSNSTSVAYPVAKEQVRSEVMKAVDGGSLVDPAEKETSRAYSIGARVNPRTSKLNAAFPARIHVELRPCNRQADSVLSVTAIRKQLVGSSRDKRLEELWFERIDQAIKKSAPEHADPTTAP